MTIIIFFLGNTDPEKNVARTLKAYSLYLKHSEKKRPLLIADLSEDKLDAILREQRIEEIKPFLSYPGYIPNTDLAYLYNGAFAFFIYFPKGKFRYSLARSHGLRHTCNYGEHIRNARDSWRRRNTS